MNLDELCEILDNKTIEICDMVHEEWKKEGRRNKGSSMKSNTDRLRHRLELLREISDRLSEETGIVIGYASVDPKEVEYPIKLNDLDLRVEFLDKGKDYRKRTVLYFGDPDGKVYERGNIALGIACNEDPELEQGRVYHIKFKKRLLRGRPEEKEAVVSTSWMGVTPPVISLGN